MFPFIFAFILAIGIPLLPSSFHRALHLPTLSFNFLSSSYAPERSFVTSSERPLLLESGYSRDSSDSGESLQYLVFSGPNYSDHEVDSDVLAYMSFTEKLGLTYPQTSIWLVICSQLLYQLVEAMVIMTLSFLFAATFLSRRSLSALMERFCTSLFICWNFTPKAAFSSFLQDVLLCVHKYWMNNSVTADQVSTTQTSLSQQVPLGVLADNILSSGTISEGLNFIASQEANRRSENSSSLALITPPRSRETSTPPEPALVPLGQPVYSTSSSIITRATNHISNYTGVNTSISKVDLSGTDEVAASLSHSSTPSCATISIRDLYSANKPGSISVSYSATLGEGRENVASDATSDFSLDHGPSTNIDKSPSKPESDESQAEGLRPSSSERSYSGRRRYKSDGVQVRSTRCHLGDPAAPPDPAKVDGTCVFWKSVMRHDEKAGEAPVKQVLAPGFPSESSSLEHTSRSRPDQIMLAGSVGSADAALTGMVLTPEGEIMVPASQRADGSMRKEIKVRPGHLLREPLVEKYRPPAARVRTSTWDPRLRELLATPPSSPYACNSSLPFTPMSVHRRLFGRQCNSPASLTNNWRRLSSTLIVVETPLAKGNDPCTPSPPPVEKLPAPEFSTLSQTMTIVSPMSALAPDNQNSLVQSGNQIVSRPSELERLESAIKPAPDDNTEQIESSKSVRAASKVWDKAASSNAEKENRLPLRDITTSSVVDRLNPPSTPTVLASTTARTFPSLQVGRVIQRDLEAPSRTPIMESREILLPSPYRKRKSSGEPHNQCAVKSAMFSPSESPTTTPHRRPRTRRSAPHLGKSGGNKRQVKAQTPESSAKRRRMRTASALGMENAVAVAPVAVTVDRSGQIVLPAGTGWKGRSLNSLIPSQLPVAQRQRQPTLASFAAT